MFIDLRSLEAEMAAWRRHIHQHPELGYHEHSTMRFIHDLLVDFGVDEIHTGIAGTGIVATIRAGQSRRAIGIRADIDALPIPEMTESDHRSCIPGVMHACGHDGHTAMLLGAAKYLAATRNFNGAVHLIFQPAEEALGCPGPDGELEGGASAMIRAGLFERFPMEAIFGIHNRPGIAAGKLAGRPGPLYAAADRFEIVVMGKGGHAARPHLAVDPVLVAAHIITAIQSIAARNADPMDSVVVSVCTVEAGTAVNIIPDEVWMGGTVRTLSRQSQDAVEKRLREIVTGVAASFGATAKLYYERGYPALHNPADLYARVREIAIGVVGADRFVDLDAPSMGGEDFARYLDVVPGCFLLLGNGDEGPGAVMLHNSHYSYNDSISPTGAAFFVALAEAFLPR